MNQINKWVIHIQEFRNCKYPVVMNVNPVGSVNRTWKIVLQSQMIPHTTSVQCILFETSGSTVRLLY